MKLLVEKGAKVNVLNERGNTPLFQAVAGGRRTIASYLVEKGANVNLSKEGAWKPIHAATYNEFPKLTKFLCENGADLTVPCKEIKSYSPLHILVSTDEPPLDIIEVLIKFKAPLNAQHEGGSTPLHLVAFWGCAPAAKLLVEAGARMDVKNAKGRTALEVAALYGNKQVAEYLAQKSGQEMPKLKEKQKKVTMMKSPSAGPDKKA